MPSPWQRVNRKQLCPICGKPDWCRISADGRWAICRRLDTGDGHRKVDKVGVEYWVYRLQGDPSHARLPPAPPSVVPPERATEDVLNQVYSALLRSLSLSPQHRAQLIQRGLEDRDITFRQYRTLPQQGRAALAQRLVETFGETTCARVPGLYIREQDERRWWSLAGAPGLVIPVRNAAGQIIALAVRSDDANAPSRYSAISSAKYRGPSPGAPIHVPLIESRPTATIRLTGGFLKADIATTLSSLHTIGLPGVSMWPYALHFLRALASPVVRLAFDMDAKHNLQVAKALRQTARKLSAEGMPVQLETWNDHDGKGIDDLLTGGKTPTILVGQAMTDALEDFIRSATLTDTRRSSAAIQRASGSSRTTIPRRLPAMHAPSFRRHVAPVGRG